MAEEQQVKRPSQRPALQPPRMTRADWAKREKTKVTLTRGELEYIGQLMVAGRALIRDDRSVSPQLRAAMTKLGISTRGL